MTNKEFVKAKAVRFRTDPSCIMYPVMMRQGEDLSALGYDRDYLLVSKDRVNEYLKVMGDDAIISRPLLESKMLGYSHTVYIHGDDDKLIGLDLEEVPERELDSFMVFHRTEGFATEVFYRKIREEVYYESESR